MLSFIFEARLLFDLNNYDVASVKSPSLQLLNLFQCVAKVFPWIYASGFPFQSSSSLLDAERRKAVDSKPFIGERVHLDYSRKDTVTEGDI